MSTFRKKENSFEISGPVPGTFQHKSGLTKPVSNAPTLPSSTPPPISTLKNNLKNSSDVNVQTQNNNNNNNQSSTNLKKIQQQQQPNNINTSGDNTIVKSNSSNNINSFMNSNNSNNSNSSTKQQPVMSGTLRPVGGGGVYVGMNSDAKKTTKSTIISGKLKRFFKQRPSRESLYEKHILAAPFGSANLSFINIFKILTALKKANALESEGIFRVNGSAENIRTLWLGLNQLNDPVPCDASHHDLSGLLKLYLRETRFPLIPMELFVNGVIPSSAEKIKEFIESKLPDENVKILTALIDYLYKVTLSTALNKMNCMSLGVCFAPSLIRPISEQNTVGISQIQSFCNFISTLIENRLTIFSQKEILPDISTTGTSQQQQKSDLPPLPSNRISYHEDEYFIPPPPSFVIPTQSYDQDDCYEDEQEQQTINPLYDEFINLLTDDSLGSQQKTTIIERMTYLFSNDSENFKNFLRDMGIEGIVSLLEYILTLDN
ncbi:RhoGAP domain-containing protein [Tieghemostelium lacteum]|uniref:RhoGAP domain-containing protein n=1 Tax=Tieghemostelium lacteum TaxID=361077 RepID=A0A151Z9H0_TIELA|nr:RhoGAP domain-containing protein [Tieghemostelium lacteum]|eukprot:KYQ90600.1 RhoGAP domain-containing protein [Tieghemostelium lacteum]